MAINPKTLPKPTPETQHFWDGARAGKLLLQQCDNCQHIYFPPRPFCPDCASRAVTIFQASGKGRLYSYVINHRPPRWIEGHYSIAVVELDEGPRLMSNIVEVEQTPEALILDMPLDVVFDAVTDDITLVKFRPADPASRTTSGGGA
ncbi:MAG: Zn-ribbon domain-containing OB-fold protein [Gammaproteobacteria bacterium]|nr:Zn-ribbon domain-containing OB-fold protein [Gammaproteobacteria bacterium]MBQ0840175.1 Zn-ribbon domain-containing OB-fold protein [Gammaproteobacteria bacterium]